MDRLAALMEILRTEYGIETPAQLKAAIKELGGIDITPMRSDANHPNCRVRSNG